jgi:hypothetical protein
MSIAQASLADSLKVSFDFVTPVWGRSYTRLFLDVSLPTFLAAGNLPALAGADPVYRIYTTAADAPPIRESVAVAALRKLMPVEINIITEAIADKYARMSFCHKMAIERADERGAAIVFLAPDAVAADGSLAALSRLADAGKRVAFGIGIRLHLEKVVPLLEQLRDASGAISIAPRELMRISLEHLHPITLKHIWGDGPGEMIANNLFWRVPGEGLLGRCFHVLPLMVYPRNKRAPFVSTIDDDYVQAACPDPADWHIVTDSDEMLFCELSTITSDIPGTPRSLENLIGFSELYASATHRVAAKAHILMHAGTRTPALWEVAARESDRVMNAVFAALERPSVELLASQPALLLRRWRRLAYEVELATRTGRSAASVVPGLWERLAVATIGRLLKAAYQVYPRFVSAYLPLRARAIAAFFGALPRPLPTSWLWLEYRGLQELRLENRPAAIGGACLFIAPTSEEAAQSAFAGVAGFSPPAEGNYEWPFEAGTFAEVCMLLRNSAAGRVGNSLAEAGRVLQEEGRLLLSGLPAGWGREEIAKSLPPGFEIVAVRSQGGRFSKACQHACQALRTSLRRVPARMFWEILLSPLLLTVGALGCGLINGFALLVDRFDRRGAGALGTMLLARKARVGSVRPG